MTELTVSVSCIIPALNEENNIAGLLSSIIYQKLEKGLLLKDIIVVDNGSTDRTVEVAKSLKAQVYVQPALTIGALRNFGARNATGEILVFLDADNVLTPDVITKIVRNLDIENIGAVGIPLRPHGEPNWVEKTWFYHIHTYKNGLNEVETLASGAFGIRKDILFKVGCFNERLRVGEDTDLANRIKALGYKILLDTDCIIYNKGFPKNLKQFMKVEFWHGDSIKSLLIHKTIDPLTTYFIFCFVSLIVSFLSAISWTSESFLLAPFIVIIVPAFSKALKRRGKIDSQFVQLLGIYLAYIMSRTASLFKW